jgi:hypothetical protein
MTFDIDADDGRADSDRVKRRQDGIAARWMPCTLLFVLLVTCSAGPVQAASGTGTGSTNLTVRPLGGARFEIGQVTLDKAERSVSFPASINLRDETVEYAVVHKSGKTHESIFRTEAQPHDVHLAMLLLGARPVMTNSFGSDGKARPLGERVAIDVSWTNHSTPVRCAMEDLVVNRDTKASLPRGEWIYNGSNFSEGAFTAQRDGSIISLHIDPGALINNPRPGRENDDLHLPNGAKLPASGVPIEITIRLLATPTNATVRRD